MRYDVRVILQQMKELVCLLWFKISARLIELYTNILGTLKMYYLGRFWFSSHTVTSLLDTRAT